jgi:hypothetical protein
MHMHGQHARLVSEEMVVESVASRPLSSSADITGLTSSCVSTRSPIMTSIPPVPLVIATQPPNRTVTAS